ncbi:hypothetical protein MHYP_G00018820 [Metynnis hypsauchen]
MSSTFTTIGNVADNGDGMTTTGGSRARRLLHAQAWLSITPYQGWRMKASACRGSTHQACPVVHGALPALLVKIERQNFIDPEGKRQLHQQNHARCPAMQFWQPTKFYVAEVGDACLMAFDVLVALNVTVHSGVPAVTMYWAGQSQTNADGLSRCPGWAERGRKYAASEQREHLV